MTGTDSLSACSMDLSDLPSLLEMYKEKYEEDLSKTDYDWVNNISVVKSSSALIAALEERLVEKLPRRTIRILARIPEIID